MKNTALFFSILLMMVISNSSPASIRIYERPLADTIKASNYTIFDKSTNIESIKIRKSKKTGSIVYITLGLRDFSAGNNDATGYGVVGESKSREEQNASGPVFDNIEVLAGGYKDIKVDKLSATQNEFTLENITFPLRLKMHAGKEFIEFELKEVGRWDVDVKYKK